MGNTYPVIEHHIKAGSLIGQPLKSGYNSHFVTVKRNGEVGDSTTTEELFDEIVIDQEAQIAPAYLLKLQKNKMAKLLEKWNRAKPEPGAGTSKSSVNPNFPRDDLYIPLTEVSQ